MNVAPTEDQIMIRDAAERFLGEVSGSAAVRKAMESPLGYDETVWQRMGSELGWCGLAIGEVHGGMGLGAVELALIQEQAGRHLLCAPFFSTVCIAASWLQQVGTAEAQARFLPEIAAGALCIAVSLDADRPSAVQFNGATLNGAAGLMLDAASADWLLVLAQLPDSSPGLFAVPRNASGVSVQAVQTWDATRRFGRVALNSASGAIRVDDPVRMGAGMPRALALSRLYLAAEQLGGAQQCLDLTVAYTTTRKQFGRAVAGFQAVKHRCAEMMVRIEALRSMVSGAAATAASGADDTALVMECAAARVLAAETNFYCAQEAIQLHGGVGFTWEYDPQLYFKRAQASSHWLGTADALREQLAAALDTGSSAAVATADADPADQAFRAEIADWMKQHLSGRYASLRHRGGPGDEEADPALRKEWERELAAGGWTCVGWPKAHGGRALSIAQQVIFHEEYARAGGPGRMGHIGEGLIGPALIRFGNAEQQQRFLPKIVAGLEYWAQGYSEPGAGSDLANVQTRCWQEADGSWRVQGQKIWTSLAHESEWIFVLARCEPGSKGNKGLAFLLLPLDQPGIEIRPIRQLGGGSEFNEVFFDGAVAAADHIVGAPGEGWKVAMGLLESERGVSTLGQQMHFTHELDLVIEAARRNGSIKDSTIRARIAQAWCGLRVMRYNAVRMLADGAEAGLRREALIYKYYWSNWQAGDGRARRRRRRDFRRR